MFSNISKLKSAALTVAIIAATAGVISTLHAAEPAVVIPAPAADGLKTNSSKTESSKAESEQTAVIAGGCFWGLQGVFEHVRGVQQVLAGYAGGDKIQANYEAVSAGHSGHAESVQIRFDPKQISYGEILHIYFSVAHDPTQLNHQGADTGTQYRSAIFYGDESQKAVATAYIAQLDKAKTFDSAIVTRVDPLKTFYAAEAYHQDFLIKNPHHPYIVYNDLPKIESLKKIFPDYYQSKPVTVAGNPAF